MANEIPHQLLRLPAALAMRGGIGKSKHYQDIEDGLMTHPVPIGANSVGWPLRDILVINAARISGRGDDEVRALVVELEDSRADALDEVMASIGMKRTGAHMSNVR